MGEQQYQIPVQTGKFVGRKRITTVGQPFYYGQQSAVVPVRLEDKTHAVLRCTGTHFNAVHFKNRTDTADIRRSESMPTIRDISDLLYVRLDGQGAGSQFILLNGAYERRKKH